MVESEAKMTIKVFISPNYFGIPAHADNGGIRRVVEAENKYLANFEVESVARIDEADIIQNQGGMQTWRPGVPIVCTNHGMMWSRQPWGEGMQEVNNELVKAMSMAVAHTAPSEWVANAIRRGGYFYPEVVYHGVDAEMFTPVKENGGYVLWNKARADYVSDPNDMQKVAELLPNVQFYTTIGKETKNVKVIGTTSYDKMKAIVAGAGAYLATARETFGIGTLEAMACGVPICGWGWGGQAEIIAQGETGYLAMPGNYAELAWAIQKTLDERDRLSINAADDARFRWKWEPRIKQYADIFKAVYADFYGKKQPKVTIIVTAYNLDQYLPACLDSVKAQTFKDFECIVVDDAQSASTKSIVRSYMLDDKRFKYLPTPENLGLSGARNFGFSKSHGRYIRHLDADDWLSNNALAIESDALDGDPLIHIAYGHLCMVEANGNVPMVQGSPKRADWPPSEYHWIEQMAHLNQIPSCVMMRREVLQRSGGYRVRNKRQEDAEFWCRVTSLGFRAKKVTEAITYFHRQRNDSKGQIEWDKEGPEPDWTAWFPWSLGAKDYRRGVEILRKYNGLHPNPQIVPFGAQGQSSEGKFWYVHDFAYPVVSIVVTCGPGHDAYLIDALDSIQAQTYPDWECIVVNDTGVDWPKYIPGAPWAKVVNMEGNQGVAAARNKGFSMARGQCIIWMDADDYWLPWFLERMVVYAENNRNSVIYSDLIQDDGEKKKIYSYKDLNYEEIPFHMNYAGSSILVPKEIAFAVKDLQGGYDKDMPGMEDWDYQIAVHSLGFCAHHLPEPLFVYRMQTSTKRERDYAKIDDIEKYLDEKWKKYRKDGVKMCGCNNHKTKIPGGKAISTMTSSGNFSVNASIPEGADPTQMVNVEYMGPIAESFSIRSLVDPGLSYRFGNNPGHKERVVFLQDAYRLIGLLDGEAKPLYRIRGVAGASAPHDPEAVVGAIAA
jgi:glycosyltransferase involved in cell wall biosynthesis